MLPRLFARTRRTAPLVAALLLMSSVAGAVGRAEALRRHCAPEPRPTAVAVPEAQRPSGHEHHDEHGATPAVPAPGQPESASHDCAHCLADVCAAPTHCGVASAPLDRSDLADGATAGVTRMPTNARRPLSVTSPPPTPPPLGTPLAR